MSNSAVSGHHILGGLTHESVQNANQQAQQQAQGDGPQLSSADKRLVTDLLVVQHAPTKEAKAHGMHMALEDSITQLSPKGQALYTDSLVRAVNGSPNAPSLGKLDHDLTKLGQAQKTPPTPLTMNFLNILYKGALEAGTAQISRVQTNAAGASATAGAAAATMPMMESPTVAATVPVAGINAVNAQQAQANKNNQQQ